MKKFIAIALLLAMCLSLFAACEQGGEDTKPSEPTSTVDSLANAKDYLYTMYKDKAGKVLRSFDLVAVVAIGGEKFPVTWTSSASEEYIKVVAGETMTTIEVVNAEPAEQVDFTLTATINGADGKTASFELNYYIEAVVVEEGGTEFVDAPAVGTAYKFALVQAKLGQTLYFTGEMSGYYLAMSENPGDAVDVTVEEVEGGYQISFTKGEVKQYIDIIPREGAEGKVNVVITDAPTAVYTWDAERKTMTAEVNGNTWYLGTYNDYNTISASATSYIEDVSKIGVSQFPAGFATVTAPPPVIVDAPVAGVAYKFALNQAKLGQTLYFTGEMNGYYLATSDFAYAGVDVVLEEVEGGFHISFTKGEVKQYIDIIPREGAEGKVNVVITDAPTAVFVYDAERKTMTAEVNGNTWYLGTYNDYNTISASATSYIEDVSKIDVSQFPTRFVTVG